MTPLTDPIAAALLAAIAESDDPTPRYALADWLEERGDARAAWVRDPDFWPFMAPDGRDPLPRVVRELYDGVSDPARMQRVLVALGTPAVLAARDWVRADRPSRWHVAEPLIRSTAPPELRPVVWLLVVVNGRDPSLVWEAVLDLGFHGPGAAPAVGALIDLFQDGGNEFTRDLCITAFGRIGPAASAAVPMLMSQIHDDRVVAALQAMSPDPELVYQNLCVEYEDGLRRSLTLLQRLAPSGIEYLIRCLADDRPGVAEEAAERIVTLGQEAAPAIPALIRQLSRPGRPVLLVRIAEALPKLGPAARAAVGPLHEALAGHAAADRRTSEALAAALAAFEEPESVVTVALSRLRSGSADARELALITLDRVAELDGQVATYTARALSDPSASVRWTAVHLLRSQIGPGTDAAEVVPPLLAALADTTPEIRAAAAVALGEVAAHGLLTEQAQVPALTSLLRALDDPDGEVSLAGSSALARWAGNLPGRPSEAWLWCPSDPARAERNFFFQRLGFAFPRQVLPRIIAQLHAADDSEMDLVGVLRGIGGPAVPALIEVLEGDDDAAIGRALSALHGMGTEAAPATAAVARHFRSGDAQRRYAVVHLLHQFGAPEVSLPILREAMGDPNPEVRALAAESVGKLGAAGRSILPTLLALNADPLASVRFAALRSLMRIAPDPAVTFPLLRQSLADEITRPAALGLICSVGGQAGPLFDEVAVHCNNPDPWTRLVALRAVIAIGPAGRALPYAQAQAADPEEDVREGALQLLAQCQGEA